MSDESVVIAIDGESKCGKTTVINTIAAEANFQATIIPDVLQEDSEWQHVLDKETRDHLAFLHEAFRFNNVVPVSGGNAFRAAAFLLIERRQQGRQLTRFTKAHVPVVREILAEPGMEDLLQHDPEISRSVSSVAKKAGAQTLCGALMCDFVKEAYNRDGGGNLVIFDARDPVNTMRRNGIIGDDISQITPASIMPIYIDTPTEAAALHMGGDFNESFAEVSTRRIIDATRSEFPVKRPDVLIEDFGEWRLQFALASERNDLAIPFRFYNGPEVRLDNIQFAAGLLAVFAQDHAFMLNQAKAST